MNRILHSLVKFTVIAGISLFILFFGRFSLNIFLIVGLLLMLTKFSKRNRIY
ncbi:hypothetical protein [Candidatus Arthromitus sp. SFB-mouse]|uniref:hypothetical protein n=1 Tax=Candidatus Arthromitus sp. SFB-mouse TaxID=49118 RepID=UPI00022AE9D8|nr:hypothetical protein [Candidatus Arthromitus sp. SFB-mouse]EGX28226.1 hypothetical protein SFBNYU_002340 [Candidatus Arthromitus sp. SFB-mouse-NYU]